MWFKPTEHTPIIFRFLAASRTSLSIFGSTRMISTSTSPIWAINCSLVEGRLSAVFTFMYLLNSSAIPAYTLSMIRQFIIITPFKIHTLLLYQLFIGQAMKSMSAAFHYFKQGAAALSLMPCVGIIYLMQQPQSFRQPLMQLLLNNSCRSSDYQAMP